MRKMTGLAKKLTALLLSVLLLFASFSFPAPAYADDYGEDDGILDFVINTLGKMNPLKLGKVIAEEYEKTGFSVETAVNLGTRYVDSLIVSSDALLNSLKNELYTPNSAWANHDREVWIDLMAIALDDAPRFQTIINDPNFSVNYNIDLTPYDYHYYENSNVVNLSPGLTVIDAQVFLNTVLNPFLAQTNDPSFGSGLIINNLSAKGADTRYFYLVETSVRAFGTSSGEFYQQYDNYALQFSQPISLYPFSYSAPLYILKFRPLGSASSIVVNNAFYTSVIDFGDSYGYYRFFTGYGNVNIYFDCVPQNYTNSIFYSSAYSNRSISFNQVGSYYLVWANEYPNPLPTTDDIETVVNNYYNTIVNNYYETSPTPTPTPSAAPTPTASPSGAPSETPTPSETPEPTPSPELPDYSGDFLHIRETLDAVLNSIAEILGKVGDIVITLPDLDLDIDFPDIPDYSSDLFSIRQTLNSILTAIKSLSDNFGDTFVTNEAGTNMWDAIVEFFKTGGKFAEAVASITDSITGLADTIITKLSDLLNSLFIPNQQELTDTVTNFKTSFDEKAPFIGSLIDVHNELDDFFKSYASPGEPSAPPETPIGDFSLGGFDYEDFTANALPNADPATPTPPPIPQFNITMPNQFGGGTYNVLNLSFFAEYRDYVHSLILLFLSFMTFKKIWKSLQERL